MPTSVTSTYSMMKFWCHHELIVSALLHLPLVQKKYGPLSAFSHPCVAVNPITRFRGGAITYKLSANLFIFQYRGRLGAIVHHISRSVLDPDAMCLVLRLLLNPRGGVFSVCRFTINLFIFHNPIGCFLHPYSSYKTLASNASCLPPPLHTTRCHVLGVFLKCSPAQTFA